MKHIWLMALLMSFAAALPANAQSLRLSAEDSRAVQNCIKSKESRSERADACIGTIADPCVETPDGQTTVGQNQCYERERLVWDDILNESYRRLQQSLGNDQKIKLRNVQRAWLESRKLSCSFYYDFIKGTLASPLGAACMNRETAQRALYLLFFVEFGN